MYGQPRLEQFLCEHAASPMLFDELTQALIGFTGRSDQLVYSEAGTSAEAWYVWKNEEDE